MLAVEVKGPKGVRRPEQTQWIVKARANGVVANYVMSLAQFVEMLPPVN